MRRSRLKIFCPILRRFFAFTQNLGYCLDERSYAELDHGKSSCSGLTLARYLIYCCADPIAFLEKLRIAFEQVADYVA